MHALQGISVCYRQLKPLYVIIWCAGMILCISYFAISYLHCRSEFQISLPVENAFVQVWMQEHSCRRTTSIMSVKNAFIRKWIQEHPRRLISLRQSDRISTPLTYGIFHPVILMPKSTDWDNTEQLQYILMHEYVHICRHDALTKLIVTCALCIHWFNPMVWIMWFLFNRDVEISCDERVVRHMGESSKSAYALMLIQLEAERGGLAPLCSGLLSKLGKNAMEERITSIMKIKKKSTLAGIVAAVLVISVAAAFATSATEAAGTTEIKQGNKTTKETEAEKARGIQENMAERESTTPKSVTEFTEEEYDMLLALKFDGYEDMSISEYRNKVWSMTDTGEYNDIIDRFFQDETIYAAYETRKGTDSNETYDFLYNVLGPIMGEQPISFSGCARTDFPSAEDNASLEYTGTLTILDADQITVREYIWARQGIVDDMGVILQDLSVSELRDEELMKVFIDEAVMNTIMTYQYNVLQVAVEYSYKPLNGVAVDDMEGWQKERRDEWDRIMAPYVPFGLTYHYDWDTDDYKMYFNGREVRGIYDEEKNLWISEHEGIGKDIYDKNATELFVVYENHKIVGLREATAQELEEITARRQAVTDSNEGYQDDFQYIREYAPATKEDYQSLFTLKTSAYQQKSIAEFDMEFLDWCNENHEQIERIQCDRGWNDYRVAMTDKEKSFVKLTAYLSEMENAEYVRSLKKNEPERDICNRIRLSSKEEYAQNGYGMAWCSLDYSFSYHISDKEKVSIGERDNQIGKMVHEIQDSWDSSDIDEILQMTKSDMLEWLQSIAAKYSNRNIIITILDDQTYFECMDERGLN
ncbi:MAG: M56 family metallopeptidase [Lachnospiraceae bacterium]|nr:M56 family metallopeptidase [Lachnospiraceae bacterium]MDE7203333.1 M56 family metallopeptidase [Lachnospiraceae bacterium]